MAANTMVNRNGRLGIRRMAAASSVPNQIRKNTHPCHEHGNPQPQP